MPAQSIWGLEMGRLATFNQFDFDKWWISFYSLYVMARSPHERATYPIVESYKGSRFSIVQVGSGARFPKNRKHGMYVLGQLTPHDMRSALSISHTARSDQLQHY